MDAILANRYRRLFLSYGVGDTGALMPLKLRILQWNNQNGHRLRWDAALFLLANFDHLIIRPYFGQIPSEEDFSSPMDLPHQAGSEQWFQRTEEALDMILKRLTEGTGEISSHQVLRSIDNSWDTLATTFLWS